MVDAGGVGGVIRNEKRYRLVKRLDGKISHGFLVAASQGPLAPSCRTAPGRQSRKLKGVLSRDVSSHGRTRLGFNFLRLRRPPTHWGARVTEETCPFCNLRNDQATGELAMLLCHRRRQHLRPGRWSRSFSERDKMRYDS